MVTNNGFQRSAILSIIALTLVQCATAAVTLFQAGAQFDYQIGGAYTPDKNVKIVTRDKSDSPVSGLYSICYINAFQTQPDEKQWWIKNHPGLLLKNNGKLVEDPGWPNETLFDTRNETNRESLLEIVSEWIDECASKGYKAIEPDNLDSYTRSKKLLKKADNLAFAKLLADYAHSKNLAFGQKNDASVNKTEAQTVGFDFAVAEECQAYTECPKYEAIYGNQYIEIEYTDSDDADSVFADACSARKTRVSVIQRDRDVVTPSSDDYSYKVCS